MVQIDNAVKQAQSSYESVQATLQARIYAEAALDAEQKKYNVGLKSTTFTVLQLQSNLTAGALAGNPRAGRLQPRRCLTNKALISSATSPPRKAAPSNAITASISS